VLRDLHIRNLAVLEEAAIELGPGFNVLSGETGAGKSIVVDSLALLAGVRASTDQIRTGAETLTVTGYFEPEGAEWRQLLVDAGLEPQGAEVVIRREISRGGRARVFVDDQPVTLKLLTELAPYLLRIHGQREELGLVDPELQRVWLDRCGGPEAAELLPAVATAYETWRQLADRLDRLRGDQQARRERLELVRYQLEELDGIQLVADEEMQLRADRDRLRHVEKFERALGGALEQLYDADPAGRDALVKAAQFLETIAEWEPHTQDWLRELEELRIRLSELEGELRRRFDGLEADPARLELLEERLARLEWLFHKYGDRQGTGGSAQLIALRERLRLEVDELDDAEGHRDELAARAAAALADYERLATRLSASRAGWARELERRVTADLADLALDKARFEVRLERRRRADGPLQVDGQTVDFGRLGFDQVVFAFSPNPGEELRPLAKVASGGELSRLYLAVQLAARDERTPASSITLVFDEVDTGISGAEAAVLGSKVRRLARGGQILAVTHLPQVASHADVHFKVSKQVKAGRTYTAVEPLTPQRRIEEVARMLAGSAITELSLSHARELIEGAAETPLVAAS
jgi:DNA repair protein RecN (Recombination protein N)